MHPVTHSLSLPRHGICVGSLEAAAPADVTGTRQALTEERGKTDFSLQNRRITPREGGGPSSENAAV